MRFSRSTVVLAAKIVFGLVAAVILTGCIADTAEDTNLPWATTQSWEGLAPLGPSVTDRYQ